ncbi:uncharacterized protein LOC135479650 [Liolophura sinensis]|uniref:uncharacterized protein LOC135479650 n=1 Tax=Liolophura sinensis TaxID=3198878 RepID=UPI003158F994
MKLYRDLLVLMMCGLGIASALSPSSFVESLSARGSFSDAHTLAKRQAGPLGTSIFFKYLWVSQCGYAPVYNPDEISIQVSSTLSVPNNLLDKAARLVYLLTRFMPRPLFRALSQNMSVGVFVHRQDLPSAFPEYTAKADTPQCAGRCDAECSQTCIETGDKFDTQWVYGGPRVLVASQNLNCDRDLFNDPQFGLLNLLVSEICQITGNLLPPGTSQALYQSYQTALDTNIWVSSTAMRSASDYFLQASLTWFASTRLTDLTTGGMNICGEQPCSTEIDSRKRIEELDPGLYDVMNEVYNNGRRYIRGGITVCRW